VFLLFLIGPIPQPIWYGDFSDQRMAYGIPNFYNVVSNIFFILIGALGYYFLLNPSKQLKRAFVQNREKIFYYSFFSALILISFGSTYYHWNPNNNTLVWDRLSITMAFMSFFSAVVAERINLRLGLYALVPLILLGFASVLYWHYTESVGRGDLRIYLTVLFLPMVLFPVLLACFKPVYTHQKYIWWALVAYMLAVVFELLDRQTYQTLHQTLSGHTIKHLFAALGSYFILFYVKKRRVK